MPDVSGESRRREIQRCADAIAPFGGVRLFRPPQGRQSMSSRLDVHRLDHDCVTWSAHLEDWMPQSPAALTARLRAALTPGAIVVLHDAIWDPMTDGAEDRDAVLDAVDVVLAEMSGHMRFVSVPELLVAGTANRRPWITA